MYNYDYYYEQEPSEIDILIDETVCKIRKAIELKAKEDIEQETLKSEKIQKEYDDYLKASVSEMNQFRDEISQLKQKYEQLEIEYNKKRQEIPSTKYCVGDKVYVADSYTHETIYCSTCNGKGIIKVKLDEYGEVEITCPACKGCIDFFEWQNMKNVREAKYYKYAPKQFEVREIEISIQKDSKINIKYYLRASLGESLREFEEEEIFSTRESCQKYCEEKARQKKEQAYKACGREIID